MTLRFRALILGILFFSFSNITYAQYASGDAIEGIWETAEKDGRFHIYRDGDKYYGKLIYGKDFNDADGNLKRDTKNPDPKMRNRTWKDAVMLHDFVYTEEDREYIDGQIYDLRYGKYYNAILRLTDNNNTLHVRGYVGISLFGQTVDWHRIE